MIPAAAVEAAARALFADDARDDDELNWTDHYFEYRRRALRTLEAAAPHIQAEALVDAANDISSGQRPGFVSAWLRGRAEKLRNIK